MIALLCLTLAGQTVTTSSTSTITYHLSGETVAAIAKVIDDAQSGWAGCQQDVGHCKIDLRAVREDHADMAAELRRAYAEIDNLEHAIVAIPTVTSTVAPIEISVGLGSSSWFWLGLATVIGAAAGTLLGAQF